MSCEQNRDRFFKHLSAPGGMAAQQLGGEQAAEEFYRTLYQAGYNDQSAQQSPALRVRASAQTLRCFEEMESKGFNRPTHATQEPRLPKVAAQFGYMAVQDANTAMRTGKALPETASRVLAHINSKRRLQAVGNDSRGYNRCSNCGQFASRDSSKPHICRMTANSGELAKAIARRTGAPKNAFLYKNGAGAQADGLDELIAEAKGSSTGTVQMVHCLTGEQVDATLDGTLSALSQGFVPKSWAGQPSLRHVQLPDERVVAVLDSSGLPEIDPTAVLAAKHGNTSTTAAAQATAAAFGGNLIQGAPIESLRAPVAKPAGGMVVLGQPMQGALNSISTQYDPDNLPASTSQPFTGPVEAIGAQARGGHQLLDQVGGSAIAFRSDRGDVWCATNNPDDGIEVITAFEQAGLPTSGKVYTSTSQRLGMLVSSAAQDAPNRALPDPSLPLRVRNAYLQRAVTATGAPALAPGTAGAASNLPPLAAGQLAITGGQPYDDGRFNGSEYKKKGSHGLAVKACGHTYIIGQRSQNNTNWSSARRNGQAPAPRGGVAVGRTTVEAVGIIADSDVASGAWGAEIYDRATGDLVSAFHSSSTGGDAGDMANTPNMSSQQMAAVIAYKAWRGKNDSNATLTEQVLAQDLDATLTAGGSPIATADSAYLSMKEDFDNGDTYTFGGQIGGATRCPHGRWVGSINNCQLCAAGQAAPSVPAVPSSVATEAKEMSAAATPAVPFDMDATFTRLAETLGSTIGDKVGGMIESVRNEGRQQAQYAAASNDRLAAALEGIAAMVAARAREAEAPRVISSDRGLDGSSDMQEAAVTMPAVPNPPQAPRVRPSLQEMPETAQEHIFAKVRPPEAPDPYLSRIDPALGGHRREPLHANYQRIDPKYDVSKGTEKVLRVMSAALQMAWDPNRPQPLQGTQMRAFGVPGTAGSGKNTTGRQVAAVLGLPYFETTLHKETSVQEEIGTTVLRNGTTYAKLGALGEAAAMGSVICINELVKANPGTLGALQRMVEDGVFEVQGTEAGTAAKEIPVHPDTIFVCSWNPGYDGSEDRPDAALLSRLITIRLDAPTVEDETRRMMGSLSQMFETNAGEQNDPEGEQLREARRLEILAQDYTNRPVTLTKDRVETAVKFVNDIRSLAATRQIGASSKHLLEPTPRDTRNFAAMCEATGDPLLALGQFDIFADSGEDYQSQKELIRQMFVRHYGDDGQALNRQAAGQGPQIN